MLSDSMSRLQDVTALDVPLAEYLASYGVDQFISSITAAKQEVSDVGREMSVSFTLISTGQSKYHWHLDLKGHRCFCCSPSETSLLPVPLVCVWPLLADWSAEVLQLASTPRPLRLLRNRTFCDENEIQLEAKREGRSSECSGPWLLVCGAPGSLSAGKD